MEHCAWDMFVRDGWAGGLGTLAAAFQSWAYGGFTPAGGIFATLTSLGMLGYLRPFEVGAGAMVATVVMLIVWACGVGR